MGFPPMPVAPRLWARVDKTDGCWLWMSPSRTGNGKYGNIRVNNRKRLVHRVAYELEYGQIPDGMDLDHLCRNTLCVRPDHLEPVTNRENILRGTGHPAVNARKTHCKRGHAYTPENTRYDAKGKRSCRACGRLRYWGLP